MLGIHHRRAHQHSQQHHHRLHEHTAPSLLSYPHIRAPLTEMPSSMHGSCMLRIPKAATEREASSNMFLAQRGLTRLFPHSTACYTRIAAHLTSERFQDSPTITCWTIKCKRDAKAGSVRCPRGRSAPRGRQWRCCRTGHAPCRAHATAAGQRRGNAVAAAG